MDDFCFLRSDNDSGNGRKLPRKTLVATGLNCNIDKGDEKYEETQHPDGKVRCDSRL